jgi:hypothetical protein
MWFLQIFILNCINWTTGPSPEEGEGENENLKFSHSDQFQAEWTPCFKESGLNSYPITNQNKKMSTTNRKRHEAIFGQQTIARNFQKHRDIKLKSKHESKKELILNLNLFQNINFI